MTLKKRMSLILLLDSFIALILIILKLTGKDSAYFNGFGIGLFSVTLPFLIYLTIRMRNREYREEYDLSIKDERIKRNSEKSYAIGLQIQNVLLISIAILSYIADFNLYFPVLGIVLLTQLFVIFYSKKLNKRPSLVD